MNIYHQDSFGFFKLVSRGIQKRIDDFEVIQLTLNFALGLERLLKGLLYDINPTYILIEPGFKHSLKCLYSDIIIEELKESKELSSNPNEDVITFRNSLLRSQHISKVCYQNKNLLFNISNARDIIVHHELRKLNVNELKETLQRDFYPFLKEVSKETGITQKCFFDGVHIKLSRLSSSLQTDLKIKVEMLIDVHTEMWKNLKGNKGFPKKMKKLTEQILDNPNKECTICPSCKNDSILYLSPIYEFNPFEGMRVLIGYEVLKLKCQFCKLEISEPQILDYFGIRDRKVTQKEKCSRCYKELESDNSTGMCVSCNEYYGTEH